MLLILIACFVAVCCLMGVIQVAGSFFKWLFAPNESMANYFEMGRTSPLSSTVTKTSSAGTYAGGARSGSGAPPKKKDDGESGLFSSTSVNLMLLTGTALFIFSVYLFVRSYWEAIPPQAKLLGLNVLTLLIYGAGYHLVSKKRIPRTAKTLIFLGLAMLPFNVYAANVLVLNSALSINLSWTIGSALMLLGGLATISIVPAMPVGALIGLSVEGLCYFGALAYAWPSQGALAALAAGAAILLMFVAGMKSNENIRVGIFYVVVGAACYDLIRMGTFGFFIHETTQIYSVINLSAMGVVFAILARGWDSKFAYAAGVFFLGAGAMLMRHLQVPVYEYGYCFVPTGFVALLRAWTFERAHRSNLARPYFWLGQMALLVAVLCVAPVFSMSRDINVLSMMLILGATTSVYAVAGAFYKNPFFSYASGLVIFYVMALLVWQQNMDFSAGTLYFSMLACGMVAAGSIGQSVNDKQVGFPLTAMGLFSLTVAMSLMAGRLGDQLYTTGRLIDIMPADQLRAGLWTGCLSAIAYVLVAAFRKRVVLLYPALFSVTWVYVCGLQVMQVPLTLFTAGWIVVASMAVSYLLRSIKYQPAARCFGLWAEMAALFIASGALYVPTPLALSAVLLCTLAFIPALSFGDEDQVTSFLLGVYLSHYLWFLQSATHALPNGIAQYSLQLVALNIGVVFLRTLVSRFKPENPVNPYRLVAFMFSIISGVLSLNDFNIAWQVYLAYGILAVAVSLVHYEGRYLHVGAILLLISAELFFAAQKVHYIELYTLPPAVFLLWAGFQQRGVPETRDFLYGVALVLLYLPSSVESMREAWAWHGIFLGIASLLVMLMGMHQRSRLLTFASAFVLVANGFIQSRQFFLTVPRWFYLGSGGLTLISLGGLFEFQRDALISTRKKVFSTFEAWD
jgi:hypothetical protein